MEYSDNYCQPTQIAYENLGNQIVMQAILDYIKYTIKLWKVENNLIVYANTPEYYRGELIQIKKFFYSDWFGVLSDIDPDTIWNFLQRATKKELDAIKEQVRKKEEKEAAKNDEQRERYVDKSEDEHGNTIKTVLNLRRSRASVKQRKKRY